MPVTTKIKDFEVLDHGIEHSQYFQGCGVVFTKYEECVTGCGDDFAEAIDDALESIAQQHSGIDFVEFEQAIKDDLGIKTVAWPDSTSVSDLESEHVGDGSDYSDCYYYVSIRYTVE